MKYETYETIHISEQLDHAIKKGLDNGIAHRKRNKKRKIISIATGIAAAFALFITVCITNPTIASKMPFIDTIFEKVQDNIRFQGDYAEHSMHLADTLEDETVRAEEQNQADTSQESMLDQDEIISDQEKNTLEQLEMLYGDTDQNITITPEEVYCDGVSLYLGVRLTKSDGGWGYESAHEIGLRESFQMIGQCGDGEEAISFSTNLSLGRPEQSDVLIGMIKLPMNKILLEREQLNVKIDTICWYDSDKYYEVQGTPEEVKRPWYHVLLGEWNLTVPVIVDANRSKMYQINEKNEAGYGIETVYVTPYEIQVKPIKPQEDEQLLRGAFVVFNENGECYEWGEQSNGFDCYVVNGKEAKRLYFYYFKDEFEAFKCKELDVAKETGIFKYELILK